MLESIFGGVLANLITDLLKKFRRSPEVSPRPSSDQESSADVEVLRKYSMPEKGFVPESIEFGATLIKTPSFEELGIPVPFAYLPFIQNHVKGGDWVNRGDLLITVSLSYYRSEKKLPLLLRIFLRGSAFDTHSFELRSPVYGFVTDLRRVQCRNWSTSGYGGTFVGVIDTKSVLPTILVPLGEPSWGDSELRRFRREVCWSVTKNWKRNVHNLGGGEGRYKRIRLHQAVTEERFWSRDDDCKAQLREAVQWAESDPCDSGESDFSWSICKYADYLTSYGDNLDEYIDCYRAQNLQLREKLAHLVTAND